MARVDVKLVVELGFFLPPWELLLRELQKVFVPGRPGEGVTSSSGPRVEARRAISFCAGEVD